MNGGLIGRGEWTQGEMPFDYWGWAWSGVSMSQGTLIAGNTRHWEKRHGPDNNLISDF